MRILFICKKNETYGFTTYTRRSSGLYNSTSFIVRGLKARGIEAQIIEVIDNNCIDRAVTQFKPDVVIIEALWVVPEKFPILQRLHPSVKWFVHLHSHMPFLAMEGIAMEWILDYSEQGIGLIANSIPSYKSLLAILKDEEILYLPNVYIPHHVPRKFIDKDHIDVGCFGAIRPLKNQLIQALAAIEFANQIGKPLRFHINGTRTETMGDPVLKNLRELFSHDPNYVLIEHPWYDPSQFLKCLEGIDIGLQVSLTETFNVVCADYTTAGVPLVASKEIEWVSDRCKAQDDSIESIVHKMHRVYKNKWLIWRNRKRLDAHSKRAQFLWFYFCEEFTWT